MECKNCEKTAENTNNVIDKEKVKNIDTFKEKETKVNNEQKIENEQGVETAQNPAAPYMPNGFGYGYPAGGVMPNAGFGNYGVGYGIHSIENGADGGDGDHFARFVPVHRVSECGKI